MLVTGGRHYANEFLVFRTLDAVHAETPISLLIQGDATGADALARHWAMDREIPYLSHPAAWNRDGKYKAGPIRNSAMLKQWKPQKGVAFPGGNGTADMVKKMRAAGIEVLVVAEEGA